MGGCDSIVTTNLTVLGAISGSQIVTVCNGVTFMVGGMGYSSTGNYTTSLVVGSVNGCYDTSYNTLSIYQSPTITVTNNLSICKGQSTQLNATGSNNYS